MIIELNIFERNIFLSDSSSILYKTKSCIIIWNVKKGKELKWNEMKRN